MKIVQLCLLTLLTSTAIASGYDADNDIKSVPVTSAVPTLLATPDNDSALKEFKDVLNLSAADYFATIPIVTTSNSEQPVRYIDATSLLQAMPASSNESLVRTAKGSVFSTPTPPPVPCNIPAANALVPPTDSARIC